MEESAMKSLIASFFAILVLLTPSTTTAQQKTNVETVSAELVRVLHIRDMSKLAGFVHPTKGVRFSPYEFVESSHRVMTANQVRSTDNTAYVWGNYDGNGDPIRLTFDAYYRQFVYDRDYIRAPRITRNGVVGKGNTTNNIREFYPRSVWMEYHYPAPSQRNNWNSLWLVFEQLDGKWYLVGVVHGEWTI
ncbi:MAG: hypothetical protein HYX20_01375 [Candidatus Yanofskybacteria bacterium]|nr:hypothetical protein [Candidatus Yanofskybacteria bacterium]